MKWILDRCWVMIFQLVQNRGSEYIHMYIVPRRAAGNTHLYVYCMLHGAGTQVPSCARLYLRFQTAAAREKTGRLYSTVKSLFAVPLNLQSLRTESCWSEQISSDAQWDIRRPAHHIRLQ